MSGTGKGVGGVFVGGASRRMGRTKGLLTAPDGRRLVDRACAVLAEAGLDVVLVGRHAAYADIDRPQLEDAVRNAGPLGGLVALLAHAEGARVVALACDMPHVSTEDVRRLLATDAPIAAPSRDARWEPLFAAYDSKVVLPVARQRLEAGERSLQGLLREVGAVEVDLPAAHLDDWDSPEDINAS